MKYPALEKMGVQSKGMYSTSLHLFLVPLTLPEWLMGTHVFLNARTRRLGLHWKKKVGLEGRHIPLMLGTPAPTAGLRMSSKSIGVQRQPTCSQTIDGCLSRSWGISPIVFTKEGSERRSGQGCWTGILL